MSRSPAATSTSIRRRVRRAREPPPSTTGGTSPSAGPARQTRRCNAAMRAPSFGSALGAASRPRRPPPALRRCPRGRTPPPPPATPRAAHPKARGRAAEPRSAGARARARGRPPRLLSATAPPKELPTRTARSMPSSSIVASTDTHGAVALTGASPKPGQVHRDRAMPARAASASEVLGPHRAVGDARVQEHDRRSLPRLAERQHAVRIAGVVPRSMLATGSRSAVPRRRPIRHVECLITSTPPVRAAGGRSTASRACGASCRAAAVRASYAVDLETLGRVPRRLWHVGCHGPVANPRPRRDRAPVRPQQPPLLTTMIV